MKITNNMHMVSRDRHSGTIAINFEEATDSEYDRLIQTFREWFQQMKTTPAAVGVIPIPGPWTAPTGTATTPPGLFDVSTIPSQDSPPVEKEKKPRKKPTKIERKLKPGQPRFYLSHHYKFAKEADSVDALMFHLNSYPKLKLTREEAEWLWNNHHYIRDDTPETTPEATPEVTPDDPPSPTPAPPRKEEGSEPKDSKGKIISIGDTVRQVFGKDRVVGNGVVESIERDGTIRVKFAHNTRVLPSKWFYRVVKE